MDFGVTSGSVSHFDTCPVGWNRPFILIVVLTSEMVTRFAGFAKGEQTVLGLRGMSFANGPSIYLIIIYKLN